MRQIAALGLSILAMAGLAYHAKANRSAEALAAAQGQVTAPTALAHAGSFFPVAGTPSGAVAPAGPLVRTGAAAATAQVAAAGASGQAGTFGALDLSRAVLRDGAYEIDLGRGRRARLTLDPKLQRAAEKLLERTRAPRAAAIVMAPDGRILALAGRRTESPRGGKEGTTDPRLVTEVWAPAASIFKLVTATALVRAGVTPKKKVCFHGGVRSVMESNLADSPRDNRCEDLSFAVAHSQNAIIAKLSHKHLSPKALSLAAEDLGFTGAVEATGLSGNAGSILLPASNGIELAKAAAGFRGSELSVLGGGVLANTLANRGVEVTPTLIAAVIEGDEVRATPPGKRRRVVDAKVADAVADMMVGTCAEGSAAKAFRSRENSLPKGLKVAGKTGTLSRSEPFPMEYSWFVGFAPADAPQLSVSVLIGNTDDWWLKGHTVARELFEEALHDSRP